MVFNISYQDTGILNFEDEGESSGPLLAALTRWSLGVTLPYAFQTSGAAFSPNISVPASGVIVHKCISISTNLLLALVPACTSLYKLKRLESEKINQLGPNFSKFVFFVLDQ